MFIGFTSYSLMYNQVIPYLIELGYSTSERSIILATFALIAMLGQIIVGYFSDKESTIKRYFLYLTWVYMASGVASFLFNSQHFLYHFVIVSSMTALTRIQCNILETWVLQVDGLYEDFGFVRAFASIGWAFASFISGLLVMRFGFISLSYVNIIINLILIGYTFSLEDISRHEHLELVTSKDFIKLFKNKDFMTLLLIFLIVFFVYNVDFIVVTELIYSFGGNAQDTGTRGFIHAIVEVPMMFIVGRLLIRYKATPLLLFGIIMLALKFILFGLSTSVTGLNLTTLLQMVSFPLILIAQRDLINRVVPENLRSTGQMITSAVTSGVSAIMSPIIAGILSEQMGPSTALIALGVFLVIPLALTLKWTKKYTL